RPRREWAQTAQAGLNFCGHCLFICWDRGICQRMDDDLRWSPADFRQSMGSDRRILLLGCASLRPDACTSDRTMVIGGAASYVITNDGIHQHPAATCQPCTACNCPQCHITWLDACADFPSLSAQR